MSEQKKLMFQPFSSKLSPGFWHQLTNVKLNKLKLNIGPVDIHGTYACNLSEKLSIPCLASMDHSSFNDSDEQMEIGNKSTCCLYGLLTCTNIIQEFNDCVSNKKQFIQEYGKQIWESICDGRALKEPEKYLSRVGLIVYADLKKYKFVYFFSFPALKYPEEINLINPTKINSKSQNKNDDKSPFTPILDVISENALQKLETEYNKPKEERNFSRGYFILKHYKNSSSRQDDILIYSLEDFEKALVDMDNQVETDLYFAFSDPSSSPCYPGWPLRNFLCLIAVQFKLNKIKIIRIRKGQPTNMSKLELQHSMIFEVSYQKPTTTPDINSAPATTGWELDGNTGGKPKRVDLSNHLDPKKLAEDAVNLNLRLMKWRLLPRLDLDKIAQTKCLLLGCGTLGCHISRGLLAWGIKNISIIDNAKISYSNPVRQTLYTFEDCIAKTNERGTLATAPYKATAAEASLKKIHPTANIKSYILSIPMPGHHVDEKEFEQTKRDVTLLENLIENHDVVFLLMDTRESRWLPTVISMSKQKLVINAAIGFDTFLLQRYGIRTYAEQNHISSDGADNTSRQLQQTTLTDSGSFTTSAPSTSQDSQSLDSARQYKEGTSVVNSLESEKLGCYFCNDIVAPGDSTLDRTLDQQCTVSRPGVSMMVSAMAIELLASIMSSRKLAHTPAPLEISQHEPSYMDDECESELGIVPHSIRCNLSRFHIYMPTSPAFEKCSACSTAVVNAYRKSGFEFLHKVFNDPSYLEEVAGLKDLQNVSDNVWALESDEDADDSYGHLVERKQTCE